MRAKNEAGEWINVIDSDDGVIHQSYSVGGYSYPNPWGSERNFARCGRPNRGRDDGSRVWLHNPTRAAATCSWCELVSTAYAAWQEMSDIPLESPKILCEGAEYDAWQALLAEAKRVNWDAAQGARRLELSRKENKHEDDQQGSDSREQGCT